MESLKIEIIKENEIQTNKPIELQDIDSFFSYHPNNNRRKIYAYIDKEKNLWYKDSALKNSSNKKYKGFVKILGLYERKNDFLLDILSDLNKTSIDYYTNNTKKDNIYLQDIYDNLLSKYYLYIRKNKL